MSCEAFTTDHFMRQMDPRAWANGVLDQARLGLDVPRATVEIALRITGDIEQADKIATSLPSLFAHRNSADDLRSPEQRELELHVQTDGSVH